jgi:hypothetical protein
MSLNQTNKSSSSSIFLFLLMIIIITGIYYCYKKKYQIKTKQSDTSALQRLSYESQTSVTSNDDD